MSAKINELIPFLTCGHRQLLHPKTLICSYDCEWELFSPCKLLPIFVHNERLGVLYIMPLQLSPSSLDKNDTKTR